MTHHYFEDDRPSRESGSPRHPALRCSPASDTKKRIALREIISRLASFLEASLLLGHNWNGLPYHECSLHDLCEVAKRIDTAQTEGELQDLLRKLGELR